MTIAAAIVYFILAAYVIPKTRQNVPFKQLGFDLDMLLRYVAEAGLYEAATFESYKSLACFFAPEYGYSKGYCMADHLQ